MPRRARIDVPGALHHTAARRIERKRIFKDDQDREYIQMRARFVTGALKVNRLMQAARKRAELLRSIP